MGAIRKRCEWCRHKYWAARVDSKWCSNVCRYKSRSIDAHFDTPKIPKSNIPGITFNRVNRRWQVKIKEDRKWKYIGSFGSVEDAKEFQDKVIGVKV